ncbi:MAG: hypothetical protein K6E64_03860 [Lachnospiraceae bacterium]|nr:hypothetical protein [Lachnospiraceae bacterium]
MKQLKYFIKLSVPFFAIGMTVVAGVVLLFMMPVMAPSIVASGATGVPSYYIVAMGGITALPLIYALKRR